MSCDAVRKRLGIFDQSKGDTNIVGGNNGIFRQSIKSTPFLFYNPQAAIGVGSAISYITLTEYRIGGCAGCNALAATMDRVGPSECLRRINEFAEKMRENAKSKKLTRFLNLFLTLDDYKNLIHRGVNLHIQEKDKKERKEKEG